MAGEQVHDSPWRQHKRRLPFFLLNILVDLQFICTKHVKTSESYAPYQVQFQNTGHLTASFYCT